MEAKVGKIWKPVCTYLWSFVFFCLLFTIYVHKRTIFLLLSLSCSSSCISFFRALKSLLLTLRGPDVLPELYMSEAWIIHLQLNYRNKKTVYVSFPGHRDLKNTKAQLPPPPYHSLPYNTHTHSLKYIHTHTYTHTHTHTESQVGWLVMAGRNRVALCLHPKFWILERKNCLD